MKSPRKIMVIVLLVFTLDQVFGILPINPAAAAVTQFSFASAGDYGFSSAARTVMSSMGSSGASFALGVGDLLYTQPTSTVNEKTWCNQFKTSIPNVELIVGNHETWETNSTDGGGSINKFVLDCPFTLGAETGTYGFRYYFDYPSSAPLARFIMVDPAIWNRTTSSSSLSYASGTANYNWVASAVDNARSNGIPWIIVVMHKVCIRTGTQSCEVPMSFLTMLMNKRVDLIIQGHDHTYQRSKQLTCATEGTYVSSCVANAGSSLAKGAGTVYVIDGTGGEGGSRTLKTPDTGYFAAYCCSTGTPLGYSLFTITSTTFQSKFVNTGGQSYNDGFTISGNTPPTPTFTLSPSPSSVSFAAGGSATSTLTVSSVNGFTGTVSLVSSVSPSTGLTASLSPSSVSLTSGSKATSLLTLSNGSTGSYTVSLTGSSGSLTKTGSVSVTVVGSSNGLSHSTTITVTVSQSQTQDFTISANPSTVAFNSGASGSTTLTLASASGFSGTLSITSSVSPSSGLSVSCNPSSITLTSSTTSGSSNCTFTSSVAGPYTASISASNGTLTRSTTVTVHVGDFVISVTPSSIVAQAGSNNSATVTLSSSEQFTGTVTLSVTTSSSNVTSSVTPSTVQVPSGGSD